MSEILIPDEYLHGNFNLTWDDVFAGLNYSYINPSFAISKANESLQKGEGPREILVKLSKLNPSSNQKIMGYIKEIIVDSNLDKVSEQELTNKKHYMTLKYVYDNPDIFPDQLQTIEDYSEEWHYPAEIRLFSCPYINSDFYPGDAEDVKKMRFKYWKRYLDETKEEYGWRTFDDYLKYVGYKTF